MVTLNAVSSKAISELGYDEGTKELFVRFRPNPNHLYRYEGVPADVAESCKSAASVGAAFNTTVKGKFTCVVLDANGNVVEKAELNDVGVK